MADDYDYYMYAQRCYQTLHLLHMLGTFDCKEKENSFNDAFQRIVGGLGPKP